MPRAVIITSYLEYPLDISALLRPDDTIVCLDGGVEIAMEQDIRPDVLIGDMDSLDMEFDVIKTTLEESHGRPPFCEDPPAEKDWVPRSITASTLFPQILQYPTEKDFTDLELALKILDADAFPEILIIGGIGGRLDQTAINLQLIDRYTGGYGESPGVGSFELIDMLDGRNRSFVVRGDESSYYTIPAQPGMYLSLLPMSETCEGVSMSGVKYPLEKATLRRGESLGISNEVAEAAARLSLAKGNLLVICSRA